jgi:hypothetical protein
MAHGPMMGPSFKRGPPSDAWLPAGSFLVFSLALRPDQNRCACCGLCGTLTCNNWRACLFCRLPLACLCQVRFRTRQCARRIPLGGYRVALREGSVPSGGVSCAEVVGCECSAVVSANQIFSTPFQGSNILSNFSNILTNVLTNRGVPQTSFEYRRGGSIWVIPRGEYQKGGSICVIPPGEYQKGGSIWVIPPGEYQRGAAFGPKRCTQVSHTTLRGALCAPHGCPLRVAVRTLCCRRWGAVRGAARVLCAR